jgi:hypothetical protein
MRYFPTHSLCSALPLLLLTVLQDDSRDSHVRSSYAVGRCCGMVRMRTGFRV